MKFLNFFIKLNTQINGFKINQIQLKNSVILRFLRGVSTLNFCENISSEFSLSLSFCFLPDFGVFAADNCNFFSASFDHLSEKTMGVLLQESLKTKTKNLNQNEYLKKKIANL